jgi:hypothetical protein
MSVLQDSLIASLQGYSPKFIKLEQIVDSKSYLLVLDPADIHIGKLCSSFEVEDYNNQIAVQRVWKELGEYCKSIFIPSIKYYLLEEMTSYILTIQEEQRQVALHRTQMGWHSNFLIAKQLYVDILEILITVADVRFCFNQATMITQADSFYRK